MISTLDVIQESFEDVPIEYNPNTSNNFYGLNRHRNANANITNNTNNITSNSTISLLQSHNTNHIVKQNYSNTSLINNSRELLLTPSQKLKIIKKQRCEKSQDKLSNNSPENLNSIDFLSDDELPDNLIVYDVPSLYSLQTLSHSKSIRRKPSIRQNSNNNNKNNNNNNNENTNNNTINNNKSASSKSSNDPHITNTNNINQQIENSTKKPQSPSFFTSYNNSNNHNNSTNSSISSPATRASSIFSRTSDISDLSSNHDIIIDYDDYLNPLSCELKLLNENKDFKLEETLQRMSMLKNMSHLSTINNLTANLNKSNLNIQYLSSTRQSNLPPKSKYEILKHERDYQNILELEIFNEKEKLKNYQIKKKNSKIQNEKDFKLWEKVINNYDILIKLPNTRELYWRDLPDKFRNKIWKRQLLSKNKIQIDPKILNQVLNDSIEILDNACNFKLIKDELKKKKIIKNDLKLLENIKFIEKCSEQIQFSFTEIKYFQFGENFDSILTILISLNELKSKKIFEKLNSIDIFKLINLSCLFNYVFNDNFLTLNCIISLISKKLPNIMLNSNNSQIPLLLSENLKFEKLGYQSNYLIDIKNQFDKYLLQLIPNLYNQFLQNDINSLKIIQILSCCIFSNQLPFDFVLRIMDIYLFEGDIFLLRTSLALLKKINYKFFGNINEVYKLLKIDGLDNSNYLELGEIDDFIHDIRNVLKKK
ncbi:hypothetical protein C6P40_002118 [Pichia californica]|uniref:Rab-GAP TBC domain-containing protein n=1 Tax=Pichia californica TaxID=460514 RepID=A0A9P7BHW6_9ASCO|nr:hypothetical protein C6P40_002118 [[Candida] californica]